MATDFSALSDHAKLQGDAEKEFERKSNPIEIKDDEAPKEKATLFTSTIKQTLDALAGVEKRKHAKPEYEMRNKEMSLQINPLHAVTVKSISDLKTVPTENNKIDIFSFSCMSEEKKDDCELSVSAIYSLANRMAFLFKKINELVEAKKNSITLKLSVADKKEELSASLEECKNATQILGMLNKSWAEMGTLLFNIHKRYTAIVKPEYAKKPYQRGQTEYQPRAYQPREYVQQAPRELHADITVEQLAAALALVQKSQAQALAPTPVSAPTVRAYEPREQRYNPNHGYRGRGGYGRGRGRGRDHA